jgi:hypothetical protein
MVATASFTVGCSSGHATVHLPADNASAEEVAHALLAAYRAGDASVMQKLTIVSLEPGALGHISHVRWLPAVTITQPQAGFAPGAMYFPFTAVTTGNPNSGIPPQKHWRWGFVLARRSPDSRWLVIDDSGPVVGPHASNESR